MHLHVERVTLGVRSVHASWRERKPDTTRAAFIPDRNDKNRGYNTTPSLSFAPEAKQHFRERNYAGNHCGLTCAVHTIDTHFMGAETSHRAPPTAYSHGIQPGTTARTAGRRERERRRDREKLGIGGRNGTYCHSCLAPTELERQGYPTHMGKTGEMC